MNNDNVYKLVQSLEDVQLAIVEVQHRSDTSNSKESQEAIGHISGVFNQFLDDVKHSLGVVVDESRDA